MELLVSPCPLAPYSSIVLALNNHSCIVFLLKALVSLNKFLQILYGISDHIYQIWAQIKYHKKHHTIFVKEMIVIKKHKEVPKIYPNGLKKSVSSSHSQHQVLNKWKVHGAARQRGALCWEMPKFKSRKMLQISKTVTFGNTVNI